jgi:hypothetical protein
MDLSQLKKNRAARVAAVVVGVLVLTLLGLWTRYTYLPQRKWAYAQQLIASNLTLVGLDEIEPYFREIATSTNNCEVMIKAYSRAGSSQRMAYFAELCIAKGFESPVIFLGLSKFLLLNGQEKDALGLLMAQVSKFPESWEIPHEVFRLMEKLKGGMDEDVIRHLALAQNRANERTLLVLDPLQELITAKKWKLAYQLVEAISNHPLANRDERLRPLISYVYRKHGEPESAKRFERTVVNGKDR